jgi:hypothetical protein
MKCVATEHVDSGDEKTCHFTSVAGARCEEVVRCYCAVQIEIDDEYARHHM